MATPAGQVETGDDEWWLGWGEGWLEGGGGERGGKHVPPPQQLLKGRGGGDNYYMLIVPGENIG